MEAVVPCLLGYCFKFKTSRLEAQSKPSKTYQIQLHQFLIIKINLIPLVHESMMNNAANYIITTLGLVCLTQLTYFRCLKYLLMLTAYKKS